MPDDRLSDVTIRHDALFSAAGTLSVHAGALTLVYSGSGPDDLMALLTHGPSRTGSGSPSGSGRGGAAGGAHGAGVLRTLRLSARSLRFVATRGSTEGQQQQQQGQAEAAGPASPAAQAGPAAAAAAQQLAQPAPSQGVQQPGAEQQAEVHSCSGVELFDYLSHSDWMAAWDIKLQRSMFRDQLTFVFSRRATPAGTPGLPVPATV